MWKRVCGLFVPSGSRHSALRSSSLTRCEISRDLSYLESTRVGEAVLLLVVMASTPSSLAQSFLATVPEQEPLFVSNETVCSTVETEPRYKCTDCQTHLPKGGGRPDPAGCGTAVVGAVALSCAACKGRVFQKACSGQAATYSTD